VTHQKKKKKNRKREQKKKALREVGSGHQTETITVLLIITITVHRVGVMEAAMGGGADPIDRLTEVEEDTEEGDILDLTEVGEDMEAEGMEEAAEGMEEVVGFVGFSVINFLHGS
jgi:hypothetical protein